MNSGRGPALGTFITDLQARLEQLSRDDLTRLLLSHAERLPATERTSFLAIFRDRDGPGVLWSARRQPDDALVQRVREFAARVAAGDYGDPEEGWDDEWHGRYGWVDEEPVPGWVDDADALFAEAGEVFLTADAQCSREVYDLLLDLFRPGAPGLPDTEPLEIWSLAVTDVPETLARYLRCVYETVPAQERPAVLSEAWSWLPWSPGPLTLAQIAGTRPEPLPDLDEFLPVWMDQLVDAAAWPPSRQRVRLLAEAAYLHHGLDTLANLAHRPGSHQGEISRIRIDALAGTGHPTEAVDAAREAVSLPGLEPDLLAQLNDRLADLCAVTADLPGAVRARQDAWRSQPTRDRLLAMVDDARAALVLDDVLQVESGRVVDASRRDRVAPDRLGCELLLLAGLLDDAVAALTTSEPLGWSQPSHPGPVVLPYLWAAATTPATPREGLLHTTFTAIDTLPDIHHAERLFLGGTPEDDNPWTAGQVNASGQEHPSLTELLAETLTYGGVTVSQASDLLDVARHVTDARIDAIVSNKHRGAYPRAAAFAFAHAEALATRSPKEATEYLSGIRTRYPRHVAFRQELDMAAKASSLHNQASAR